MRARVVAGLAGAVVAEAEGVADLVADHLAHVVAAGARALGEDPRGLAVGGADGTEHPDVRQSAAAAPGAHRVGGGDHDGRAVGLVGAARPGEGRRRRLAGRHVDVERGEVLGHDLPGQVDLRALDLGERRRVRVDRVGRGDDLLAVAPPGAGGGGAVEVEVDGAVRAGPRRQVEHVAGHPSRGWPVDARLLGGRGGLVDHEDLRALVHPGRVVLGEVLQLVGRELVLCAHEAGADPGREGVGERRRSEEARHRAEHGVQQGARPGWRGGAEGGGAAVRQATSARTTSPERDDRMAILSVS